MGCWQLAHGHHHPDGTQGITTTSAPRTSASSHQYLDVTVPIAPRLSRPHQHPGHRCLMTPRRSPPHPGPGTSLSHLYLAITTPLALRTSHPRCTVTSPQTLPPHATPSWPSQRCPPGPNTPHHGLKELDWSHSHPTAPGDSQGPTVSASSPGSPALGTSCSPQPPPRGCRGKELGRGLDPTSYRTRTQTYPPRR